MSSSAYILWLEGVNPERLTAIPSLAMMLTHGVDLHLVPQPLVEQRQCYYQTLTGMGSGKFGCFDAVQPEGYRAHESGNIPEGAQGRLLPDILRNRQLSVTSLEITDVLDMPKGQSSDFVLIRLLDAATLAPDVLNTVVEQCLELLPLSAHFLLLTDVWSPAPKAFVNSNNFLADIGLLEVGEPRHQTNIVWPETLAYGLGTGQIWINLRGREPQGVVSVGREYQDVCDAVIRELRGNWRDPQTNEPVVEQVFKKDEIYTGDYLFRAPDLITVYRPGYAASPGATALHLDEQSVQAVDNMNALPAQAPYARLIARGPSLVSGFRGQAQLIDIVPNVMYLLGLDIPLHIDGQVIENMFTESYRQQVPIKYIDDEAMLSEGEEELVVDRLRDLGYLG